ncbi:MAG TPA: hypothetical protein VFV66_12290, partial [Nonomuraea sp.]|nr:hypothetical protein [Nonomuraea sp.]
RRSRWLLAPLPTFALWRRMVLWEIRSYPDALGRERDRILAKTDLQDRYGRLWQFKAPRRERALYRLGELAPKDTIKAEAVRITPPAPAPAALPPAPRKQTTSPTPRGKRLAKRPVPNVDDLMPLGWRIAADLETQNLQLTRDRLLAAVRETGQSLSTERASALLARLKTEEPTTEPTPLVAVQREPEDEAA